MKKKAVFDTVRHLLVKNGPGICVAVGIAGMAFATVAAIYETPKAMKAIEEHDREKDDQDDYDDEEEEDGNELNEKVDRAVEVVKVAWKFYIPTVVSSVAGACLILKSHSMMKNRLAALTAAYTSIDAAYKLYKKNALDILGEKKEKEIQSAVAKDRLKYSTPPPVELLSSTKGTLCYDAISDRYFRSNIIDIKKAVNEINRLMLDECYVSLNELYYEIGLPPLPIGDELGWRIDDGLIDVATSSQLAENDEPCLVIEFLAKPSFHFSKAMF